MSEDICTIHQALDEKGRPITRGSQVRLPDGSVIPGVVSIECRAHARDDGWETVIVLRAKFGAPIQPKQEPGS